jgi:hypothetical protein
MLLNRKARGGILALIGYILSPLSWWNDLVVNIPLALGAAWLVAWVYPPAFQVAAVVAYWMSNVLGLVLLHKGGRQALGSAVPRPAWRRELLLDLAVSLAYTLLIVALLRFKVLQPVGHYFEKGP